MSRQLIICCDGTNNNLTGGAKDTNVTKLCDLLAPEGNDQLLYYDPGPAKPFLTLLRLVSPKPHGGRVLPSAR